MSTPTPSPRGVDPELLGKAARLHYEFGLTHQEIGELLRLSRVKVTRLLQQARDLGIVQIEVRTDASPYASLEVDLTSTFGLDEALIVPGVRRPGAAAARDRAHGRRATCAAS